MKWVPMRQKGDRQTDRQTERGKGGGGNVQSTVSGTSGRNTSQLITSQVFHGSRMTETETETERQKEGGGRQIDRQTDRQRHR